MVEDPYRYLPPVNTRHMPPQNPHHTASVGAATCHATHATIIFPPYLDSTCITHWFSHTNSRWRNKNRSCEYCQEEAHITSSCTLKRLYKQYQEADLAAKTGAQSVHTMAKTEMQNSAPAPTRRSLTPATTSTHSSQDPHRHTTTTEAIDSEENADIME